MCLILLAWRLRPDFPLILAANRDEFYARSSAPAEFWSEHPAILAGRDLEKGGTWLGVTRTGRVAAVTNYRDGRRQRTGRYSRGELVTGFLRSTQHARDYLSAVHDRRAAYDGFNLIVGSLDGVYYYSNRSDRVLALQPGVHGLSNHLLNSPWPKVERGKARLRDLLTAEPERLVPGLFELLGDQTRAADHELPDTGVGPEWERLLSSAFIRTPDYGTRCTTLLLVDAHGNVSFVEHTHGTPLERAQSREYSFKLEPAAS